MKRLGIFSLALLMPLTAFAASPEDPVNRIMDVAKARWETNEGTTAGYFDNLDGDFSKNFAATYRENTKYPAYDEGDTPFDYDVITSSQDGCPLKDLTVSPTGDANDPAVVDVRFKLWTCAPDAESQGKVNELKFDVVTEGGKPVISDIHRLNEGKWDSLVAEMQDNIERGKNP
ncbi:hypothetical protein IHQ71_09450 [Rhizobium sp. TH2]|uniref:hypothetical protein n=1 Tax=Rhizobium sp. TH2 TaxID=2775403 RepID=UPI0021586FAD|nr:hypothetical protein [Rhizobium sp. TH2]UVC10779.1 hypothetical protein IHQ71_09450 [Rhizobium sp. TH2]